MDSTTEAATQARPRVLVVEDTAEIAELLATALGFEGYVVERCADGSGVMEAVAAMSPDLVLLDVMLPGIDGFEVQRRLGTLGDGAPAVLLLTARGETADKVRGLELGADDYMTKPFSVEELLARVKRILRQRSELHAARAAGATGHTSEAELHAGVPLSGADGGIPVPAGALHYEDLILDAATHDVTRGGRHVDLTPREFELLAYLLENAGRVVSKSQILDAVWHYDFGGDASIVETYISYLRRKVDAGEDVRLLQTVRGVGYTLRLPRR